MAKWPRTAILFRNRLWLKRDESTLQGRLLPEYIVGTDICRFNPYEVEGLRPDLQDRVFYRCEELQPLTPAAREFLAAVKEGG